MRRLTVVIILIALCIQICACAQENKNERAGRYEVAIWGVSDSQIWGKEASIVLKEHKTYTLDEKVGTKDVQTINKQEYEFEYYETHDNDYGTEHIFTNRDDWLFRIHKKADSDQLSSLQTPMDVYSVPDNLSTESEYCKWNEELLLGYGITDLGEYTYSCETQYITYYDNHTSSRTFDYFFNEPQENQEIASYKFYYKKYINGYETSDMIVVGHYLDLDRLGVRFCENRFSQVDTIEMDEEEVRYSMAAFVQNAINTEKYTLNSYEIKGEYLTFIDNRMCYLYEVVLDITEKNNPEGGYAYLKDIIVFLE